MNEFRIIKIMNETTLEILKENKADVTEILKRLKEHPTDLQKMAGVYVKAEKTATKLANALPKDVII